MLRLGARRVLAAASSAARLGRGATSAASAPRLVATPASWRGHVLQPHRAFAAAGAPPERDNAADILAAAGHTTSSAAASAAAPAAASTPRPADPAPKAAAADLGEPETFAFQSETRRVLDIVTHSLYTERDILVRELVSNACDALEKVRLDALSRGADPGVLDIRISTSSETLMIEDSGCGMTREDLIANLGTIARSGTAEFAAAAAAAAAREGGADGTASAAAAVSSSTLIGRFGVGFYSAFMVASRVEVFTRAPGGDPLVWRSNGDGAFTIGAASDAEAPARGTRVVLHLSPDAAASGDFSTAQGVERILKKHSAFLPHPVFVDGARVNTLPALWALRPSEVTEEQHAEFYGALTGGREAAPAFQLHWSVDSPLSLNALLYFPKRNEELSLAGGLERMEPGVSLYCRKVLIQKHAAGLLPPYLRFLKGAVDCEDVPLNIGREMLQDAAVVRRLKELLTVRATKFLADAAKKEPKAYDEWFGNMGTFIKEGLCSEMEDKKKEALAKLLRYESTKAERGELTSLEAALERAKERLAGAEGAALAPPRVYYYVAQSRDAAINSPYLEAFAARGIEVLLLYTPADEIVMKMLGVFQGAALVSAEEADLSAEAAAPAPEDADAGAPLSDAEVDTLCLWLKDGPLEGEVAGVRASARLTDSPACITGHMPESLRRLQAAAASRMDAASAAALLSGEKTAWLELNPRHPLVKRLAAAAASEDVERKAMAALVAAQVLDSARIAAGAIDDPRAMLKRLSDICAAALA